MSTATAISHIFINNYHPLITSLFLRMLYIRATGFVKNVELWKWTHLWSLASPLTTWKHGKTSHLKLLVNMHSWTSEVEVLWLNLPVCFTGAVCHILATNNSTWCSAIQMVLTLLPTIHNSNPHWPHDPNRTRTYYSPPHLSNQVVLFCVDNVLYYVVCLFVCKCVLLPPGVNPIAVKYIISSSLIMWGVYEQSTGSCKGFTFQIFHIHQC